MVILHLLSVQESAVKKKRERSYTFYGFKSVRESKLPTSCPKEILEDWYGARKVEIRSNCVPNMLIRNKRNLKTKSLYG